MKSVFPSDVICLMLNMRFPKYTATIVFTSDLEVSEFKFDTIFIFIVRQDNSHITFCSGVSRISVLDVFLPISYFPCIEHVH